MNFTDPAVFPRPFYMGEDGKSIEETKEGYIVYINKKGASLPGYYTSPTMAMRALEKERTEARVATEARKGTACTRGRIPNADKE